MSDCSCVVLLFGFQLKGTDSIIQPTYIYSAECKPISKCTEMTTNKITKSNHVNRVRVALIFPRDS